MRSFYFASILSLCILLAACASSGVSQRAQVADTDPVLPMRWIKYERQPVFSDFVFDRPESVRKDLEGNFQAEIAARRFAAHIVRG